MAPGKTLPRVSTRTLGSTSCTPNTNGCVGLFSWNGAPKVAAPLAMGATRRLVAATSATTRPMAPAPLWVALLLTVLELLVAQSPDCRQLPASQIGRASCRERG